VQIIFNLAKHGVPMPKLKIHFGKNKTGIEKCCLINCLQVFQVVFPIFSIVKKASFILWGPEFFSFSLN